MRCYQFIEGPATLCVHIRIQPSMAKHYQIPEIVKTMRLSSIENEAEADKGSTH